MAEQLRSDPVRRNEVRLICRYSRIDEEHYYELTLPVRTFRFEQRNGYSGYVGDPVLWQPVLDQLAAEAEADYQAELRSFARSLTDAAERRPRPDGPRGGRGTSRRGRLSTGSKTTRPGPRLGE